MRPYQEKQDKKIKTQSLYKYSSWHSDLLLGLFFLVLAGLYALLMIYDRIPLIGAGLMGIIVVLHWILSGRLIYATPMDFPTLGLLALLPLSLIISVDWALSLPKVYGLVLGIAMFYLIVNVIDRQKRLHLAIYGLVLLAIAVSMMGFLSLDLAESRLMFLNPLLGRLYTGLDNIPGIAAIREANANTLGGTLSFFPPMLVSLIWDRGGYQRMLLSKSSKPKRINLTYKFALTFVLLITLVALILVGSRGGWLGTIVGFLALIIWKDKRFLWLIPLLVLGFILASLIFAGGDLKELIMLVDENENFTLSRRFATWRSAIALIQDFPVTGGGIGTSGLLSKELYTFTSLSSEGMVFYAHNNFLTAAVDLGIPGLALYAALLGSFGQMAWHTFISSRSLVKAMAVGLGCGMLAHQVFGLLDGFMLGSKMGIVMWIYFGLMAALFVHRKTFRHSPQKNEQMEPKLTSKKSDWPILKKQLIRILLGFSCWILICLASLSLINFSVIISLGCAILGGILMGVFQAKRYRKILKV